MKTLSTLTLLAAFVLVGPAQAHESHMDIDSSAEPALASVDRFSAALSAGDLDGAGAELAADVIIFESGGAERSAAEYLDGHAKHDAEFLKSAHHKLLHRIARASGDLAWIASESELHVQKDGKPAVILSTETIVLRSTPHGWKIVHIHWSSRTRKS